MNKFNSNYDEIIRLFRDNIKEAMNDCGKIGTANIVKETPVLTGDLKSANKYVAGDTSVIFVNDKNYAGFVNYGTYKMSSNPFFNRGLINSLDNFKSILLKYMKI